MMFLQLVIEAYMHVDDGICIVRQLKHTNTPALISCCFPRKQGEERKKEKRKMLEIHLKLNVYIIFISKIY